MNRDEIKSRARLSDSAVDKLSRIESVLPLMADLAGADLFIDCMQEPDGRMLQPRPDRGICLRHTGAV